MIELNVKTVVTTIQAPTPCMVELARRVRDCKGEILVIGDTKGPFSYDLPGTKLFTIEDQLKMPFALASLLPTKHYARKNLGYLEAIRQGATCIYETDDDNMPNTHWAFRNQECGVHKVQGGQWVNVYRLFADSLIWPRGFPLHLISNAKSVEVDRSEVLETVMAPIQQGLADGSPDVDAIWRLVLDRDFTFDRNPSVLLTPGTWCPFNSQSTWWWPVAYPLMYLPSFCSFRMTDIWRSFIAQRCLWALGAGLVFHAAEAIQERNQHNLMRDFEDEIPGYNGNMRLVKVLEETDLPVGPEHVCDNLVRCYEKLIAADFFPSKEMQLVLGWIEDVKKISPSQP